MNRNQPTISKGVDWSLIWLYLLLVAIGIMAIFAATYRDGDPIVQSFFSFRTDYSKQLLYFFIAGMLGIFILLTDSKFFTATANLWYALGILLMLLVFPFHSNVKGTESIIRFGSAFQFQPAEFCKVSVCLALAKYLSLPDQDFTRTRSQLIATALALAPAVLSIAQKETGLALVYFSFFIVMYREGLPATVLIVFFSVATLVVATLLMDKWILVIILTGIALVVVYLLWRQIRRDRLVFVKVALIWGLCVFVQLVAVPFLFKNVFKPYQTQRIFATLGRDVPTEYKIGRAHV